MAYFSGIHISDRAGAVTSRYKDEKSNRDKLAGGVGEILTATVVAKDKETTTVQTGKDTLLRLPGDRMNAALGDEVYFEIVSSNKEGLVLKQIEKPMKKNRREFLKQTDLLQLTELMQKTEWIPKEENPLSAETLSEFNHRRAEETMDAVKRVKRRLPYASGGITQSIVAELTAHGVPLHRISMRVIDAAMKETGDFQPAGETPLRRKETEETIRKKIADLGDLNDETVARLIKSGRPVTIENIYIAKYSSVAGEESENKELLKALMPIIRKTMAREGITDTTEQTALAKLFVRNEIPITKENMEKANFLKNLQSSVDFEALTDEALAAMQTGRNPYEITIFGTPSAVLPDIAVLRADYENIAADLPKITPRHIDIAMKQAGFTDLKNAPPPSETLTLKQLRDVLQTEHPDETEPVSAVSPKAEAAWVTLNEIRLKLSWDAVARLADKNIKIDTLSLREAAERLKAVEQKKYTRLLKAVDAPAADGQIEKMTALFGQIRSLAPLHPAVAPAVSKGEIPFTIVAVSSENSRLSRLYDALSAHPTAKYGDSFEKISGQIPPMLEKIGVEESPENISAAEALIKNKLPVTPETLAEVKLINGKINEIYDRLNPLIAAEMIKSGLDPSEMPMDEVIAYIDTYSDENGGNTIEKIARTIRRMEENHALSDKERASVLAVYKMLNKIKKNGAAALGLDANTKEPTLGELLSASKNIKKARITAAQETPEAAYQHHILKRLADQAAPETLIHFVQNNGDFSDMRAEKAFKKLREAAQNENAAERLTVPEVSRQTIRFMQENGIPVTPDTIDAAKKYLSDKKSFSKSVNQLRAVLGKKGIDAALLDDLPSSDRLADTLNGTAGFDEGFMEKLEDIVSATDDFEVIEQIDLVRKTAEILAMRRPKAGGRAMPIQFNGSVTEIDLYVVNPRINETDQTDIFMSLDAGALGEVQLILKTENDNVSLFVTADDDESLYRLKENESMLREFLDAAGYALTDIRYRPPKTNGNTMIEFPAAPQGGRIYETV